MWCRRWGGSCAKPRASGWAMSYCQWSFRRGIPPEAALNDNKAFEVVWQTLNAIRSHDERFEGMINRIELGEPGDRIGLITLADWKPAATQTGERPGIGRGAARDPDTTRTRPEGSSADLVRRTARGDSGENCREVRRPEVLGRMGRRCRGYCPPAHRAHHGSRRIRRRRAGDFSKSSSPSCATI